jgi:hypothetical protein
VTVTLVGGDVDAGVADVAGAVVVVGGGSVTSSGMASSPPLHATSPIAHKAATIVAGRFQTCIVGLLSPRVWPRRARRRKT